MAVNPLDLQTNFMQMSKVGKQQSLSKEHQALRQDHASEHVQKDGTRDAEEVPHAKKIMEEGGKVKNEKEKEKERKKKEARDKREEKEEEQGDADKRASEVTNPDIGRKIDLLG